MNAVPKRWYHGSGSLDELKPTIGHVEGGGLVVECEIVDPPSAKGRTVFVHFMGDEVEHFMKELKDMALFRRSKPMSA